MILTYWFLIKNIKCVNSKSVHWPYSNLSWNNMNLFRWTELLHGKSRITASVIFVDFTIRVKSTISYQIPNCGDCAPWKQCLTPVSIPLESTWSLILYPNHPGSADCSVLARPLGEAILHVFISVLIVVSKGHWPALCHILMPTNDNIWSSPVQNCKSVMDTMAWSVSPLCRWFSELCSMKLLWSQVRCMSIPNAVDIKFKTKDMSFHNKSMHSE